MYRFLFFIAVLAQFSISYAQSHTGTGSVQGNLLDAASGKGLPGASLRLTGMDHPTDISQVADKNGAFDFEKIPQGYYRLSVDLLGYAAWHMDSIHVYSGKADINLGDISLNSAATQLNEVVVYAEKPLIENKDGNIVYNVSESPLSNGSNASEMLRNMPLLTANPDGTLLMAGKEPLILMDEKPINLSGQQLSDLLESLPASVIDKVEIMQNPPPEYATYPGGVINIITRKGRIGIYKRLNLSGGSRGEGWLSGNFNYRSSNLNVSSSLGAGISETKGNSYSHRQNIYPDSVNYFYSESQFDNHSFHPNGRIQVDYDFNKRSNLSLTYQGNLNHYHNESEVLYTNRDSLKEIYQASTRSNGYDGDGYSHSFSGSYMWQGSQPGQKLQVFSGISFSKNQHNQDFYQQFLLADFRPTGLDSTQVQLTNNFVQNGYTTINFTQPLNDTGNILLSTGASWNGNNNHNVLDTRFLRKSDRTFLENAQLSNDFYYNQNVYMVRAALVLLLPGKTRFAGGVHAEYTSTEFRFLKGNVPNANNAYWRLLPHISLRKEFNDHLSAALDYRETIRRPGMTELNPSIDYSDPYNIRFGNPYVQPALTDVYNMNFSYVSRNISVNGNLGYNHVKNVFSSIRTLVDSGKTQTTYQNISDQDEYNGNIWTGITLSKKFRVSISGGFNYNVYSEKEKLLYNYINGGSYYSTITYSYAPDNLTILEANNQFNNFASPQGHSRSNLNMSLSIQRKFFQKKLIVGLSAIDPFGLQEYHGFTSGTNFNIESYSVSNTQNFRLSLSYQLSRVLVKSKLDEKDKAAALQKLTGG
ncbi:MAG TPA: outer membrane beta-barrel protein [Sediminibacterium sp.]|nr:outer membrane beta-barrel protein [Sediminibacterium sp.]